MTAAPRPTAYTHPEDERFAPHDLQVLQDTLAAQALTLTDLVRAVTRYPRTIAVLARQGDRA